MMTMFNFNYECGETQRDLGHDILPLMPSENANCKEIKKLS
jgi:hypothetical protein